MSFTNRYLTDQLDRDTNQVVLPDEQVVLLDEQVVLLDEQVALFGETMDSYPAAQPTTIPGQVLERNSLHEYSTLSSNSTSESRLQLAKKPGYPDNPNHSSGVTVSISASSETDLLFMAEHKRQSPPSSGSQNSDSKITTESFEQLSNFSRSNTSGSIISMSELQDKPDQENNESSFPDKHSEFSRTTSFDKQKEYERRKQMLFADVSEDCSEEQTSGATLNHLEECDFAPNVYDHVQNVDEEKTYSDNKKLHTRADHVICQNQENDSSLSGHFDRYSSCAKHVQVNQGWNSPQMSDEPKNEFHEFTRFLSYETTQSDEQTTRHSNLSGNMHEHDLTGVSCNPVFDRFGHVYKPVEYVKIHANLVDDELNQRSQQPHCTSNDDVNQRDDIMTNDGVMIQDDQSSISNVVSLRKLGKRGRQFSTNTHRQATQETLEDIISQSENDTTQERIAPARVYKLVFVGDSSTGKTSYIHGVCGGKFVSNFKTTVGVDYRVKNIQSHDGRESYHLQLWDTAGQERFRSFTSQYFRNADCVLLFYDVSNEKSFLNVRAWMDLIKKATSNRMLVLLVGNKVDLRNGFHRCVDSHEGALLSEEHGAYFIEVRMVCKDCKHPAVLFFCKKCEKDTCNKCNKDIVEAALGEGKKLVNKSDCPRCEAEHSITMKTALHAKSAAQNSVLKLALRGSLTQAGQAPTQQKEAKELGPKFYEKVAGLQPKKEDKKTKTK